MTNHEPQTIPDELVKRLARLLAQVAVRLAKQREENQRSEPSK